MVLFIHQMTTTSCSKNMLLIDVSQSNSKRAREKRLLFFENMLANESNTPSENKYS